MTSGRKADSVSHVLVWTLCACVLAGFPLRLSHAASGSGVDLTQLMRKLAEVRTADGRFIERKYISILSEPLVMKGSVQYQSPDYVRKEYDGPERQSYEIRGDHLVVELADGRKREISVDDHPALRAFVESYRGTLAGDLETLQRYFELELDGRMENWLLRLTPRGDELADYLSEIVVLGRNDFVYSVETLEASGDRSIMTLEPGSE